ncbi:MAG TPA: nucleoside-diphosphate sugar epimerase/dehydratase [Candidatus Atribacteria bacterium]|nr:nucleoside-diphosphate sugar epimerase/dehydratase [Candidatus Atribacteria bacterium]
MRRLTLVLLDIFLISLTLYLAFVIKHGPDDLPDFKLVQWITIWAAATVTSIAVNYFTGLYRNLWQYASINELLNVLVSGFITEALFFVTMLLVGYKISYSVHFLVLVLNTVFLGVSRLGYRMLRRISKLGSTVASDFKRVLIIGAGDAGVMVIRELRRHYEMGLDPVALIDDDKLKHGCRIMGVKVHGGREKIIEVVDKLDIDMIIVALPSAPRQIQTEILEICKQTKCKLKILPGVYEIINDSVSVSQLRDVQIEDLLGREPVNLNIEEICGYIQNETVLVTGGGGSIGSELCRQIARFNPRKLLILDIYENNAYDLQQELLMTHPELDHEVIIASVRDRARLEQIFEQYRPSAVFHAAAHKHVPLMEHNPSEAIKNNVFGTLNTAECADKYGVKRFVLISTDKAVNPTNIMGATKRIAEMIIQGMNKHSKTEFVAVRFGNVLGSNGSVIPLFKKQIAEGGPVTVTHPEINRFFMTIPEAVQLVLEAGSMARGGEIFVLDMGKPVKIVDLARDLIRLSGLEPDVDIEIKFTGLRPGEKLYEELLMSEEGLTSTSHSKIFIGKPSDIDINKLRQDLEKLKFVMNGPKEVLMELIKEIVPTYSMPATEAVATLDDNA